MQRVYDQLLAVRGNEAGGEELHTPQLRLRLLRSLARLLTRAAQRLRQRLPQLSYTQRRRGGAREVRKCGPHVQATLMHFHNHT